jgi:phage gp29-like protein
VRDKQLKTKQTDDSPRIGHLRREFAEHPSSGLTPSRLVDILTEAEQGNMIAQCYLAEDIEEKDGHIFAELFKRKAALSGIDFEIKAPPNPSAQEQKDANDIEEMLRDFEGWHELIFNMGDGILKGFSNLEMEWGNYRNWRMPTSFEHIPATFFQLHQHDQRQIVLRSDNGIGEQLRPYGWIQHRHIAKSGYPARQGLIRQLSWPFIFKNYSVRDLAEFLEIYGIPNKIGKYPSGATNDEKNKLLQAVLSIGHNAGGIIPKGMEIEFNEAAKGGGSDPFMTMMSWCERTQSKAILGQTLTAEAGNVGSQALGNVHNEVRGDIRDHDLNQLKSTLNRDLIQPLYMLNGKSYNGDPRRKPRLVFDTQEPEDLGLMSEAIPKLVGVGARIPVSYLHNKLRIPMPEGNEPILTMGTTDPVGASGDRLSSAAKDQAEKAQEAKDKQAKTNTTAALKLAFAALKANPVGVRQTQNQDDGADLLTAKLKTQAATAFGQIMQPIQTMVDNAESLPQLLEQLLELEDTLDTKDYEEVMAQAFVAAELAGRFDVSEGE